MELFVSLQFALEMANFQLRHGNDLLAMDSLTGYDVSDEQVSQLMYEAYIPFVYNTFHYFAASPSYFQDIIS